MLVIYCDYLLREEFEYLRSFEQTIVEAKASALVILAKFD